MLTDHFDAIATRIDIESDGITLFVQGRREYGGATGWVPYVRLPGHDDLRMAMELGLKIESGLIAVNHELI